MHKHTFTKAIKNEKTSQFNHLCSIAIIKFVRMSAKFSMVHLDTTVVLVQ